MTRGESGKAAAKPPRYGLTIGLGDIMRSRKVMLLVSGSHKNAMMKRLLDPLVRNDFPASYLWLHPNAVCMCDQAAVEGLHLPQSP